MNIFKYLTNHAKYQITLTEVGLIDIPEKRHDESEATRWAGFVINYSYIL
jgi:hypothetical protein